MKNNEMAFWKSQRILWLWKNKIPSCLQTEKIQFFLTT